MRLLRVLVATLSASVMIASARADIPEVRVRIEGGLVEGVRLPSGVLAFKGIPYAAPPVGKLRWRAPAPAPSWDGVRQAARFGNVCMQSRPATQPDHEGRTVQQTLGAPESEDCLYLNVWSGAHDSSKRLPVLVWIYGGGYVDNAASRPDMDGEAFARDGVVLVSFNYRGGVLGYLVHPALTQEAPYHSSGNYGSLDQIAALKWVKNNIAAFGGDPSNVTLFGQSAGSGSINMLQASPLAKGLFNRVIGESTTQLDFTYGGRNGNTGRTFATTERLGLQFQNSLHAASLEELRTMPATVISTTGHIKFYPIQGDGYFLPRTVYETFQSGHQNDVAVIAGSNADEGVNLTGKRLFPATAAETAAYEKLYGADRSRIAEDGAGPAQSIDDALDWQAQKWAALERTTGTKASYSYFFSHVPPDGRTESGEAVKGAVHGSEVPYVFDNLDKLPGRQWTGQDRKLARTMHSYWLNFARTGNPNGPGLPDWPQYDPAVRELMIFSDAPHAGMAPRPEAWDFLNGYYSRIFSGKPN